MCSFCHVWGLVFSSLCARPVPTSFWGLVSTCHEAVRVLTLHTLLLHPCFTRLLGIWTQASYFTHWACPLTLNQTFTRLMAHAFLVKHRMTENHRHWFYFLWICCQTPVWSSSMQGPELCTELPPSSACADSLDSLPFDLNPSRKWPASKPCLRLTYLPTVLLTVS